MVAVAAALETTVEYLQFGVSDEELEELGGAAALEELVVKTQNEIKEVFKLTDVIRKGLTVEAVHVGYAFDRLLTIEQKDAVIAQFRAFGTWELEGDGWELFYRHLPASLPKK